MAQNFIMLFISFNFQAQSGNKPAASSELKAIKHKSILYEDLVCL